MFVGQLVYSACGNTKTCSYNITVNETTPQAEYTNCPTNITVTAASGATSAIVNYTAPTLVKYCPALVGNSNLVQGLASGSSFPIGVTTVRYNTGGATINLNCEFTVSVIQPSGCPGNLLTNGDFEQGSTGWTGSFSTTPQTASAFCSGPNFIALTANNKIVTQSVPATAGKTYALNVRGDVFTMTTMSGRVGLRFKNGATVLEELFVVYNSSLPGLVWETFPLVSTGLCGYRDISISKLAPVGTTSVEVMGEHLGQFLPMALTELKFDAFCLTESASAITMTCPADLVLNTLSSSAQCAGFGGFVLPTATSTCAQGGASVVLDGYTVISGAIAIQDFGTGGACGGIHVIGPGVAQVNIKATDACGNVKNCTFKVTQNMFSPSVAFQNCPANITVTAAQGASGAVVNYAYPTIVLTNCGGIGVNSSILATANNVLGGLPSGSNFPVGTTTVALTANCNAVQAVCTFNVTVNPPNSTGADLELSLTANNTTVPQWGNVTFTLTAKNNGTSPITSAKIHVGACSPNITLFGFAQNAGLVYASVPAAPTKGSYNFVSQEWTITNLAPGQSGVLTLPLFNLTTAEKRVLAWTAAQSPTDPDSQPFGAQPSGCAVSQDDEAVFIINLGQSGLAVSPQSSGEILEKTGDFAVFPNPTNAFCSIELSQFLGKKLDIAVSDIFGKKVFFEKIAELKTATIDLDLSREMAGVYFIKIEAEGQRAVVKRLIISKL
jgi:hypothetical protein